MNLYAESLANYLIDEWARIGSSDSGTPEARFIIQSLSPESTFELFSALENQRIKWIAEKSVACHFKVANALWSEWQQNTPVKELDKEMARMGGITANGQRAWIDEEDRLTWYRSRTAASEQSDGLLVVLVGLNHAKDQGGLKDFHRVDENRIWHEMGESFIPWLQRIDSELALGATDIELERFDATLQQLFKLRPMRLGQFGNFIDKEIIVRNTFFSVQQISDFFLTRLPHWGIPPIIISEELFARKVRDTDIKLADEFISHQRYMTKAGQRKDWKKITEWLDDPEFVMPQTIKESYRYNDVDELRETLRLFIYDAEYGSHSRLLNTDVSQLLNVLRLKDGNSSESKSIPTLKSQSLEAFLEAIWITVANSLKGTRPPLTEPINSIGVQIDEFQHDLVADDIHGEGPEQLAKNLLKGCLGGLDQLLSHLDCKVPTNSEQAREPRALWTANVPINFTFDLEKVHCSVSRANPKVRFKVTVSDGVKSTHTQFFNWALGPSQPERVRFECGKRVLDDWIASNNSPRFLPAFEISSVRMTALYFASDEEEANRLLTHAMTGLKLIDLLKDLDVDHIESDLWHQAKALVESYRAWLDSAINEGFFTSCTKHISVLLNNYIDLAESTLNTDRLGSTELLPRLYKAFLVINENAKPDRPYLPAAIVWGLSPAMLELSQANVRFLCDGFSEAIGELVANRADKALFSRLIDLGKIQRPLTALLTDSDQRLSATVKSFGLLHYLGPEPSTDRSLAVQSLLREEESDDDGDVGEFIRSCEEKPLVERVLRDYQQLYPASEDGLRILAANVKELSEILSGIDFFLKSYLKDCSPEWPPFNCTVMVYSRSSSPLAIESQLKMWREHVLEHQRSHSARPLNLTVGHRYAPFDRLEELLHKESQLYDISFLFHFLRDSLSGRADPALPFEYEFGGWNGLQFPIAEYPRPIRHARRYSRQSLLSNRRLRIQTRHADLSARLAYSHSANLDHLIFGEVNYQPWAPIVQSLHKKSHWVACIDPFIDKGLLSSEHSGGVRKIVGFSSGLGAYGELNVTLSTEQDTLKQLSEAVKGKLTKLLPHQDAVSFETIAAQIVQESEEIIGLASLRAVVGIDEKIREVIGFAAIRRAFPRDEHPICQLVPIDSLLHWYVGSEVTQRPDLLRLALEVREGDIPLIHAAVIECKLANKNPDRLTKACDQVQDGLRHLTTLLAPVRNDLDRVGFDRRYWWAQLHRAITSRATVNVAEQEWKKLELALEQLTEGQYEIHWQGIIFTFWTNAEGNLPTVTPIFVEKYVVTPPFRAPSNFTMRHIEYGYDGLIKLFDTADQTTTISLTHDTVTLRPEDSKKLSSSPGLTPAADAEAETPRHHTVENYDVPHADLSSPNATATRDTTSEAVKVTPTQQPENKQEKVSEQQPMETLPEIPDSHTSNPANKPLDPYHQHVPERILIGQRPNGDPVYWHYGHPQLANRHLLLFGTSGSGKTYGIQCLLAEMAKQCLHSFIVDYTDGFTPNQMEDAFKKHARPKNHFVVTEKLPLSPLRRQQQIIDPSIPPIEENNYQIATRIQSIFSSVFELGSQQSASLIRAIQTGLEEDAEFSLGDILDRLRIEGNSGETLANKLQPFVQADPFREADTQAWPEMLGSDKTWVNVLQLKGLSREIQKAVTEFTLWDLWDYAQNNGTKQRPIPIVLDEIQNLDHSSDSPIDKMLREGRKFGLSLILATQTTSQFDAEQRDRLFQAAHKLFFKPATTEIDRFAQILSKASGGITKAEWATRLSRLEKGQCWSLGPVLRSDGSFREEAVLLSITALEERFV